MMKKVIKLFCRHIYVCVQLSFSSIFNFDLIFGPFWTPLIQPIFGVVPRLNNIQENTDAGEPFLLGIAYFSPLEAIRFILFLAGQVKNK